MSPNITVALAMLALISAVPVAAQSAAPSDFDNGAFADAQVKGQRILIEAYAPWCVTCRLQAPAIAKALQQTDASDVVVFRLTEATRNSVWRRFNIQRYGTLVAFAGPRETMRAIGVINNAAVAAIINSSRQESISQGARNDLGTNQKE